MKTKTYMYAVRDAATGKLVTNLTNPGHKYWEKRGNCINAIESYNKSSYRRHKYEGPLELVTFELVEVTDEINKATQEKSYFEQLTFEDFN